MKKILFFIILFTITIVVQGYDKSFCLTSQEDYVVMPSAYGGATPQTDKIQTSD